MSTPSKRFCVINLENSTAWERCTFSDMFEQGLRRENDEWRKCEVASGENLPDDILENDGIVLTGSHFNCRDRETLPWFDAVCQVIRSAAESGNPKIFGGCFGCQIIAFALNGTVDYNPSGRFVLKAEDIKISSEFFEVLGVEEDFSKKSVWKSDGAKVIVSHGDCVIAAPAGSKLLASSNSCTNEIYLSGARNNILAFQSHPEFEYDYAIKDLIWPAVVETRKRLSEEEIQDSLQSFERFDGGSDSKDMLKIISDFLHKD